MAFQKVAAEAVLQGSIRKEWAWKVICDYSQYPAIMDNVDKVEITSRTKDEGVSRWFVSVDSAPLAWVEKDYFDRGRYEIVFKSIEGDFDNINGRWHIKDSIDSGIKIRFEIEYNLGIPVIEEVLGTVLREKMKLNIDKMLFAVQKQLGSAAADERKFPRVTIGKYHPCVFNNQPNKLFVLNYSAGGIMTRYVPGITGKGALKIAAAMLDIVGIEANEAQNRLRFVFRHPLTEEAAFKALLGNLAHGSGRIMPSASVPQEAIVFCNDEEVPIRVLELSPTGMIFSYPGGSIPAMEALTIGNTAISLKEVVRDEKRNIVTVRFADPLDDEQYKWVKERFKLE